VIALALCLIIPAGLNREPGILSLQTGRSQTSSQTDQPNRRDDLEAISLADRDLIGRVVYAEAAGELKAGQIAVARVILNRVKMPGYPKTVRGVVFQKNAFESVNGKLWREGKRVDVLAEALKSKDDFIAFQTGVSQATYFKRMKSTRIGGHLFYSPKPRYIAP
jgi:spore germination cell wall hydrolase CwlJ-like protein